MRKHKSDHALLQWRWFAVRRCFQIFLEGRRVGRYGKLADLLVKLHDDFV